MLEEAVDLVNFASAAGRVIHYKADGESEFIKQLENKIADMVNAIARHDEQKRKTDEAICLLFRATALVMFVCEHEGYPDADAKALVARAERLLGFAQLESASA